MSLRCRDERIVVRAPNWVGDAVMATPFLASLRRTCPEAEITCLCRPLVADIFRHNPEINEVLELDEPGGRSRWTTIRGNAARLKGRAFDLAVCLPNSLSSALIFFFARIPERVGYRGDWRRGLLTRSAPFAKNGNRPHRVESYLRLLALVSDRPAIERLLKLVIDSSAAAQAEQALAAHGVSSATPSVTIAPGAAQPNKIWPADRFAMLARRLADDGLRVVLVGGPNERELAELVVALSWHDGVVSLAGSGPLLFTAEIIRRSSAFVGNDSGLAHVAAAVGTPVVVLSGPGDPTEVAPYDTSAITIAKRLFCKPCYKNHCWRKDKPLECLELIEVEEVLAAVTAQVNRNPAKSSLPSA